MIKRIGLLTGGGDCPGLNTVIRAIVRDCIAVHRVECVGILRGWRGLLDGLAMPLTLDSVSGILPRGGTILRTSSAGVYDRPSGGDDVMANVERFGIDALIVAGTDTTFASAWRLHKERGLKVVAVPTTIDNDVFGTEYTFGFDSTVNIAMEAIDRVHTTAESHDRVMIVEVMGRMAGWIALNAGIAAGADMILIPEKPVTAQEVCDSIQSRHDRGRDFSIVVVAEGARISDKEGRAAHTHPGAGDGNHSVRFGGVGVMLAREIERRLGYETRVTVLGHIQRGGAPTAFDRVLGTRFGVAAVDMVMKGDFGKMVALKDNRIVSASLEDAATKHKFVPQELYHVAQVFFG